jgi:hypothetical protein
MRIQGPNGTVANVDDQGRLDVFGVSEPEDKYLNQAGAVHSVYFTVTPAGANDYFYYLKNTGTTDLNITDIRIQSTVATTIYYEQVSGTPTYVTGTDTTNTNRNLGSSRLLDAESKYDTDITGLTSEGVVFFETCDTAGARYKLSTTSNIIIPQGKAIAFKREAATGEIEAVVSVVDAIL